MADIPVYPLDSPDFQRALMIQNAIDNGETMLLNPAAVPFSSVLVLVAQLQNAIIETLPCLTVQTAIDGVNLLDTEIADLQTSSQTLNDHMNTLLFGDDQGSIISGGFQSNVAQAQSANTLFNTTSGLASIGGIPGDGNGGIDPSLIAGAVAAIGALANCDLFQEFFGSLFGAAEELYNRAIDALNEALAIVGRLMTAINAAVTELVNLLNQAIAEIQALINEMITLVQMEIQAFLDWLQRQLDLAFGAFLAALQDIPCVGDLVQEVQTPQLDELLTGDINLSF